MMIQDAQVHLAGYVAADPAFKKVAGDTSSVKLRVAYTARRRDKETGEWGDGPTSFVNVRCWRRLAENVARSLRKGEPVLVAGRLQVRRFEDAEGRQRSVVEIEANTVGHDLSRGVALFSRTHRAPGGTAAEAAAAALAAGNSEPADGMEQDDADPDGAGPDGVGPDGAELADETGHGGRPAPGTDGGPQAGTGVIDERAVAEFANELSESFEVDPAVNGGADAEVTVPA
jgi:single-strand DNA-binding protein